MASPDSSVKIKKEDVRKERPVRFTSVPEKVIEQIILETISKHTKYKKVMRKYQLGFMKGKFCLTNWITLYEMAGSAGSAVDVLYII